MGARFARLRRKGCRGKVRYDTAEEARGHIVDLIRNGKAARGTVHSYPCDFCGGHHVGHRRRTA